MEFGRIDTSQLDKTDLSLPEDHAQTKKILQENTVVKTKVYVGCAKWGRADWVGKIYPRGTKASHFLDEYAKHFNCIEFNSVYYGLPSKEQLLQWKNKTGKDFLFCPKFTEVITHDKRLVHVEKEINAFFDCMDALGEKMGPLFLLPHPQMGPQQAGTILSFLDALPPGVEVFTELRHPGWFTGNYADHFFSELEKRKRGVVITDSAGRRDCVHMRLTTPDAFIRFVGNSLHASDYARIDAWVQRIKHWMQQGLQRCFFFMHQHDEKYSPELCKYFIDELNAHCGLGLKAPRFIHENKTLFD